MSKKVLIALIVILVLAVSGVICRNIEVQQQSEWTNRSENLLKVKKYPKKKIPNKNLFGNKRKRR